MPAEAQTRTNQAEITVPQRTFFENQVFHPELIDVVIINYCAKKLIRKKNCSEKSTGKGSACWGSNAH